MNSAYAISTAMQTASRRLGFWFALLWMAATCPAGPAHPVDSDSWRYQLLAGSTYLDDCLICGRPSFQLPLRGSFQLSLADDNPLFTKWRLSDIHLYVGSDSPDAIRFDGTGEFVSGGEVAVIRRLTLKLTLSGPNGSEQVEFDSGNQPGNPSWPGLRIATTEVTSSLTRVIHLDFDAMPIRDLWFTTRAGFTPGNWRPKPRSVQPSELVSDQGRVVLDASTLKLALGILSPSLPAVDAARVAPGGVVQVSFAEDVKSTLLGTIHHGDLVGLDGKRAVSYSEIGGLIGPMPPAPDSGLDAAAGLEDGTALYSITSPIFSETLGVTVGSGDVLASNRSIWRTNAQLLKAFRPLNPNHDYGLDALYVWPDGEVWFSTEESVQIEGAPELSDGDLLSDTGRVIYRNRDLLAAFSPLEDLANFGLDSVIIASDAVDGTKPPELVSAHPEPGGLRLTWKGPGRFFQVLAASSPEGPFDPATPVQAGNTALVSVGAGALFFRLQQWF